MALPQPIEIGKGGDRVVRIKWDDGSLCDYTFRLLAKTCPCANCRKRREEAEQKKSNPLQLRMADPDAPPEDPILKKIEWVGNYALRLTWEKGCEHGIYSFDLLKELCGKSEDEV
ncbi:MAG: DUF971 domain-containing protein [Candidatus Omnitrophica bacterium]|nr:DUF971 domain-containing protein [Candidatus Omnitrophota bacterium]MCA9415560.1 DUF971 domain-containing protein [Candidatus Omnitrophota bacterium]MCA9425408.1 DUF971 domain-containing protein [Candidatus Omnitrophota bacterium]MCA9437763.1 DUF971 domain-containing protein [Candidatus Omnitrophota bacterium]MCA9442142.1 DUF971 domain-containing protein [Candidatus Omnitrophota bacterium]